MTISTFSDERLNSFCLMKYQHVLNCTCTQLLYMGLSSNQLPWSSQNIEMAESNVHDKNILHVIHLCQLQAFKDCKSNKLNVELLSLGRTKTAQLI